MTLITMPQMYGHQIAGESADQHIQKGVLFDYVLAGNGLFLRAKREGLSVCMPIAAAEVRALPSMKASFEMKCTRVPKKITTFILDVAREWAVKGLETLIHISRDEDGFWHAQVPEQNRSAASCRPTESGPGSSYERAFIEAHSHHAMKGRFSLIDDKDETGFRIYVVLGEVFQNPTIRVRVGVYGYFWEVPADWVFEMPNGLTDCVTTD